MRGLSAIQVPTQGERTSCASAIGDWRADRIGNGAIDNPTPGRWFDKSAFTLPQSPDGSWHFGSAGRDILASDGPANLDAGLMKTFDITERVHAQFRWEVFNLSNRRFTRIPW